MKEVMFGRYIALAFVLVMSWTSGFAQPGTGKLKGKVIDKSTGEPVPFANVKMEQGGVLKGGAASNFDGVFLISAIPPGEYDVTVTSIGFASTKVQGVRVSADKITFYDFKMQEEGTTLDDVIIEGYKVPLIDKDGGTKSTITRDDIAKMPGRSAASVAATVGGVSTDANGNINSVRGSRSGDTYYFIDGIKVRGSANIPRSAMEEVSVVLGGIPANYGDITGGVISITTRGATNDVFGGVEVLSSGFKAGDNVYGLDQQGYNMLEGYISGPLWVRKDSSGVKKDPLMGFFLSANFTDVIDKRPFGVDHYVLSDAGINRLTANPYFIEKTESDTVARYAADYLGPEDLKKVSFSQNNRRTRGSMTAKLTVNLSKNMDLSFGGTGSFDYDNLYDRSGSLMNFNNYAEQRDHVWRAFGRFTQRFSNSPVDAEEAKTKKSGGVSNANYTLMVDYSRNSYLTQDRVHQDNFFNYGYVGKFDVFSRPSYTFDVESKQFVHQGYEDTSVVFTPSSINPVLANYTEYIFNNFSNITQLDDVTTYRGLRNGDVPVRTYDMWYNYGEPGGQYSVSNTSQFRVTASGSADIGNHAVGVGFEYEQRSDRYFTLGASSFSGITRNRAYGLWDQMRRLQNAHMEPINEASPNYSNQGSYTQVTYDRLVTLSAQRYFDRNLRNKLGMNPDGSDFLNIDAYDPSMFSLDMFSADELLNEGQNFVYYYGYDYTGKPLKGKPSFDDFFTETIEGTEFKARPIGAFEPVYVSGYIMDKFAFDDIIFNVGVRVDRFDANQQVLKDLYSTYQGRSVKDVSSLNSVEVSHPASVNENAMVYVNDISNPSSITGYRFEDTWYDADGNEVSDPNSIGGVTGRPEPFLAQGVDATKEIAADGFEDYTPQVNVMPRVAFSFPISDEALFFAHYDVLTKRPTSGLRIEPIKYLFLRELSNPIINNPSLKPEKTIDYSLGFQQVLTQSSSLKISAFYREQRDQVALSAITGAYPGNYMTYRNIDFGTVKGMTIEYDLRRSGNIQLRANYTLQFASATGSSANASSTLASNGLGNLRTIFPTSRDRRHKVNIVLDYRFGEGTAYNGPKWFGVDVLKNTGLNVVGDYSSGLPYSASRQLWNRALIASSDGLLEGTPLGARLPGQFNMNLAIDRSFKLKFGKDGARSANLNISLICFNVLGIRNVNAVYGYSKSPDDDGFLAAPSSQSEINTSNNPDTYRTLQSMKVNNPFNLGLPRSIRLGAKLDF